MFSFYNSIDINTLTSLSETFPYALTDGARFSLPAISSKVGGVAKLIIDGQSGYLFDSGDFDTLSAHLRTLCRDKKLRTEMGGNFERRARELFSLEKTRDTQLEIYGSIIRRSVAEHRHARAGVTICGAYGQKNSGDDAILESIVHSFRSFDRDIPIRVMTRTPKATAKAYRVKTIFTFNPIQYRRAMRSSKLFIGGGGSLIQNVTSRRSLWFYLHVIKSAKKHGCNVMMYGCGIGPVNGAKDRRKAAETLNRYVDTITLREDRSLAELKSLEVTTPKIVLSADPALKLPCPDGADADAVMRAAGLDKNGGYIGFSLRRWPGFAQKAPVFAGAADYAYEKYGLTPIFISFNSTLDTQAAEAVMQHMKAPGVILSSTEASSDIVALLTHMRALVSMRLHGLIFASGRGVPLIGIAYDPKVSAFLHYIDQGEGLDFDALSYEQLKDAIDSALSSDNSSQSLLVNRLTELESQNISCARELL